MKIKKVLFTITMIIATVLNVNSQSRENKKTVEFSSESQKLTKATGWEQNEKTGKWVENKNVIDDRECPSYWVSHVSQNFKWIQFRAIKQKDEKYFVFLYESLGGEYKYPNIREDWEADKRTYFFILTSEEYENIKSKIDLKSEENIKISSKMNGYISDRYKILGGEHLYNEENLLAKITKTIEKPSYSESCLVINSQTTDGNDILRFRLPESCYIAEKNIKTAYFEVKLEEFKTILTE
ncbi:hypothetical protein BFP78_14290 [Gaetbulibacter sp. 5U11]|nr:hypothetical protein BFP78_14290 [Gaetbulibacter sp. 5U11]